MPVHCVSMYTHVFVGDFASWFAKEYGQGAKKIEGTQMPIMLAKFCAGLNGLERTGFHS